MASAFGQTTISASNSAGGATASANITVAAGSALVVRMVYSSSGRTFTISDGTNTFSKVVESTADAESRIWVALNVLVAGTYTVTVTANTGIGSAGVLKIWLDEITGHDTGQTIANGQSTQGSTNTNHPFSPSALTCPSGSVALGVACLNSAGGTITPKSGWSAATGVDTTRIAHNGTSPAATDDGAFTSTNLRTDKCCMIVLEQAAAATGVAGYMGGEFGGGTLQMGA